MAFFSLPDDVTASIIAIVHSLNLCIIFCSELFEVLSRRWRKQVLLESSFQIHTLPHTTMLLNFQQKLYIQPLIAFHYATVYFGFRSGHHQLPRHCI